MGCWSSPKQKYKKHLKGWETVFLKELMSAWNWLYKDDMKTNRVAAVLLIWHGTEFRRNHLNKKEDRCCGRNKRCCKEEESIGEVVGGRAERNSVQKRLSIFGLQSAQSTRSVIISKFLVSINNTRKSQSFWFTVEAVYSSNCACLRHASKRRLAEEKKTTKKREVKRSRTFSVFLRERLGG